MRQLRSLAMTIVLGGMTACTGNISGSGGGGAGSDIGSGSGSGSGSGLGSGSGSGSDNIQPTYPTAHPRIYLGPNMARLQAALTAATPAATRFQQVVDSWVGGASVWGFESWNAALLGQLTGQAKYCTAAIADIQSQVSAAQTAMSSGALPVVTNDSYLEVGGLVGGLALVYYWCNAQLTSAQKTSWLAYANQAVYNVWNSSHAAWAGSAAAWDGWGTMDPSDNYFYSFLEATMLLGLAEKGDDSHGDTWIDQFRQIEVMGDLVPTFDSDLVGGGSREGTGYGVAMRSLFMLYDFWQATTGEPIGNMTPHTHASMLSMMHQIVPSLDRFAPTGDQSRDSTASMFDYQRAYLQQLIALYPTDPLASRAQGLLAHCSVPAMTEQFMAVYDFINENRDVVAGPLAGGNAYYAPGIGELYARSGWTPSDTWVNLIAGPYTESHAHQDQGSLMIYKGEWLAYDAVVNSNSGLRQETGAHSLVAIASGGSAVPQIASTTSQLVALHTGVGWLYAASDVTAAYGGNPAVSKVQREMLYLQPNAVIVYDRVTTASGTTQTWQLASPIQPAINGQNATITGTSHSLSIQRLQPSATASVYNYASQDPSGDYNGGYRLDEQVAGGDQRFLHVLSIDGAVASATGSGDSVTVNLANGQTATIAFSHSAIGATLTYGGQTKTLATGIDTLPE